MNETSGEITTVTLSSTAGDWETTLNSLPLRKRESIKLPYNKLPNPVWVSWDRSDGGRMNFLLTLRNHKGNILFRIKERGVLIEAD